MSIEHVSTYNRIRIGSQYLASTSQPAARGRTPAIVLGFDDTALLFESAYEASRTVDVVTELNPAVTCQIEQVVTSREISDMPYAAPAEPSPSPSPEQ